MRRLRLSRPCSARATGQERDIDVSLLDAALQNLTYLAA
jgi:hypothetical protein